MDIIAAILSLICLIVFFFMASNLSSIAKSSRNSEAILRKMLANSEPKKEEPAGVKDEFAKYKAKI